MKITRIDITEHMSTDGMEFQADRDTNPEDYEAEMEEYFDAWCFHFETFLGQIYPTAKVNVCWVQEGGRREVSVEADGEDVTYDYTNIRCNATWRDEMDTAANEAFANGFHF